MEVKVIERKQASGNKTLYLEYYETGFRKRENLHLTIYPEDGNAKLAKSTRKLAIRQKSFVANASSILPHGYSRILRRMPRSMLTNVLPH